MCVLLRSSLGVVVVWLYLNSHAWCSDWAFLSQVISWYHALVVLADWSVDCVDCIKIALRVSVGGRLDLEIAWAISSLIFEV